MRRQLRGLAESKISLRVTNKSKASLGFAVKINGETVHVAPSRAECMANLKARLQCWPKTTFEVSALKKGSKL